MSTAPFALLRAAINGGAPTSGGLTVPASATVQLSADPRGVSGVFAYRYEIYDYPVGFTVPAGWSTDSAGTYFYSASATPPSFTLPAISLWGKWMLRLTVNNGISPNPKVTPTSQLVDEATALDMLSPSGQHDTGFNETSQWSASRLWLAHYKANLRALEALTSGNVPLAQTFTSSGTWTKPANAVSVDIVLVGGGNSGGNGVAAANGGGGGGGASGGVLCVSYPTALLPASLTVTVGAAGAISSVVNGSFQLFTDFGNPGSNAVAGAGGAGGGLDDTISTGGVAGAIGGTAVSGVSGGGGGGGTGVNGGTGGLGFSGFGAGGNRVAGVGHGGSPGAGYGAGGGGGGGDATGTNGGGGGGGGAGYGVGSFASAGQHGNAGAAGGAGAPGVVVITTWRGV